MARGEQKSNKEKKKPKADKNKKKGGVEPSAFANAGFQSGSSLIPGKKPK